MIDEVLLFLDGKTREVVRRIQDGSITRCYFDPKLGIVDTANH